MSTLEAIVSSRAVYFHLLMGRRLDVRRDTVAAFARRRTEHRVERVRCVAQVDDECTDGDVSDAEQLHSSHLEREEKSCRCFRSEGDEEFPHVKDALYINTVRRISNTRDEH